MLSRGGRARYGRRARHGRRARYSGRSRGRSPSSWPVAEPVTVVESATVTKPATIVEPVTVLDALEHMLTRARAHSSTCLHPARCTRAYVCILLDALEHMLSRARCTRPLSSSPQRDEYDGTINPVINIGANPNAFRHRRRASKRRASPILSTPLKKKSRRSWRCKRRTETPWTE